MPNWIPADLHESLSPVVVSAAEWPDARALTRLKFAKPGAVAMPAPSDRSNLGDSLGLVHPALQADFDDRLYATEQGRLYYRLTPRDPSLEGDDHQGWQGWASWAPCTGPVRAFCLYAHAAAKLGDANQPTLDALLERLLVPPLLAELQGAACRPSPSVQGPKHYAAIYRLESSGYGMAYPYLYAYTDGERVVAALQTIAHGTLPA